MLGIPDGIFIPLFYPVTNCACSLDPTTQNIGKIVDSVMILGMVAAFGNSWQINGSRCTRGKKPCWCLLPVHYMSTYLYYSVLEVRLLLSWAAGLAIFATRERHTIRINHPPVSRQNQFAMVICHDPRTFFSFAFHLQIA